MHRRQSLVISLLVSFAVACSDAGAPPTGPHAEPLLDHFPGHEQGERFELTLAAPGGWDGATLATSSECLGGETLIAEGGDGGVGAGVQETGEDGDVRFELLLSGVGLFGDDPICLGHVRPDGDWRNDFILEYRQRGRNAPEVLVVWHFRHGDGDDAPAHDLRTGWTTIDQTWDQVLGGETVEYRGTATIREGRTTLVSGVPLAFDFRLTSLDGGGGGDDDDDDDNGGNGNDNGDEEPCHRNPNHPCHRSAG